MKHIICFSGGKDSTALVLWALENLPEFITVFCDTGWESPITYAYIEEINQKLLGGQLVVLKSDKYPEGFAQMCCQRTRCPSALARFCTEALKVKPMIAWLQTIDDEVTVYQGIRAAESASRSRMAEEQWSDDYDAVIKRPLLSWSAMDCFGLAARHGITPNPLYLMGAGRVGCFPCIMITLRELKAYLSFPELGEELKRRLLQLEAGVGSNFFEPTYIPARFCSGRAENPCGCAKGKSGRDPSDQRRICPECNGTGNIVRSFPWAQDVFHYIESVDENQLPLLPGRSCMSIYNLCE